MEKVKIGFNAGTIWHLLKSEGKHSSFELCRKLNLSFEEVMLAIGWLARENKITINIKNHMLFAQTT